MTRNRHIFFTQQVISKQQCFEYPGAISGHTVKGVQGSDDPMGPKCLDYPISFYPMGCLQMALNPVAISKECKV